MNSSCSPIWRFPHKGIGKRIISGIKSAVEKLDGKDGGYIFFRADDIAVPGKNYLRLINLFNRYSVPLALAVVPAWLTEPRAKYLLDTSKENPGLYCFHQHGWIHRNHEPAGKNQEFGKNRSLAQKKSDLIRGRKRLEHYLGDMFWPSFTPPWNRCDMETLKILRDLGYHGISKWGTKEPLLENFPNAPVTVDLHTRKETDPEESMSKLISEIKKSISGGLCGIMIHHQVMNDAAFFFLESLIKGLLEESSLEIMNLKDLFHAHRKVQLSTRKRSSG